MDQPPAPTDLRTLYPAAAAPAPAPLLWRAGTPPDIVTAHDARTPPPSIRLFELGGVVHGGRGLFAHGDALAVFAGYTEWHVHRLLTTYFGPRNSSYRIWTGGLLSPERRIIRCDTPVLTPIHPNWVYGHFLLEALPLALLLDRACPKAWPIALARCEGHWLPAIMRTVFPDRPFIEYDPASEVLSAPGFIGCTHPITSETVHPATRDAFDAVKARMLAVPADLPDLPDPGRLFLSRGADRRGRRHVTNNREIDAQMAALGYSVIRPEHLSFAAQVRVFDRARIVVGEYSSAMHNAVFCRPGTTVVCLNYLNAYQSRIAAAFGHRIGYVPAADGRFHDASEVFFADSFEMRFDPDEIAGRLRDLP